jgi:biopolymer transport protein ExbB
MNGSEFGGPRQMRMLARDAWRSENRRKTMMWLAPRRARRGASPVYLFVAAWLAAAITQLLPTGPASAHAADNAVQLLAQAAVPSEPGSSTPGSSTTTSSDPAPATSTGASPEAAPAVRAPDAPAAAPRPVPLEAPQIGEGTLPRDLSPWGMFMAADIVVKAIMIGLALASMLSWTVWLAKSVEMAGARRRARGALRILGESRTLHDATEQLRSGGGPVAAFARAAEAELRLSVDALENDGVKERVVSRLERIEAAAGRHMTRGTGILATIGSTGPFVGLFGTVWGIMNSFIGISKAQTTNLAVVAPGIAEALLATALGLAAAIPAVVIYNAFSRSISGYRGLLGDGAAEVMRLVSRDLDRTAYAARRLPKAAE